MIMRTCVKCGKEWECNYPKCTMGNSVEPNCRCFECFWGSLAEKPKKVNRFLRETVTYYDMMKNCFPAHFDEIYSPKEKVVFT